MDYEKRFWNLDNNKLAGELLGIKRFHDAGYKGQGINVANLEKANYNHPIFRGKVHDPTGTRDLDNLSKNFHGDKTVVIQHMVAPESEIYLLNTSRTGPNDDKFINSAYKLIKELNISTVTKSNGLSDEGDRLSLFDDLFNNHYVKFTVCGHNFGWDGPPIFYPDRGYSVSGVHMTSKGKFHHPSYAVKGRPFRAVNSYVPMYTPSLYRENGVHYEQGTSFSTPFFAGMLALVDCFFLDKIGRTLRYDEMNLFILDNQVRLEDVEGEENWLFVLPSPGDIDVDKYLLYDEDAKDVADMKFEDVKEDSWYYDAVEYVTKNEIMRGYSDGTFRPNANIKRSEVAKIIYDIMNSEV